MKQNMEHKSTGKNRGKKTEQTKGPGHVLKRPRKTTEYGRQLNAKQTVKRTYGMREKQFRRFFDIAVLSEEVTGDMLLSLLERRLDNVMYRLKFATTRRQARQVIVHGHVLINGKKVHSPSCLVSEGDEISYASKALEKDGFLSLIDKRFKSSAKVPDWLELNKESRKGRVLRNPVRSDVVLTVDENAIVELYSK